MRAHHRFDVRRIDILRARQDHVLLAVDDVEEAVGVEPPEIPGAQPAASQAVRPGRLAAGGVVAVVARHEQWAQADDLARFARRHVTIIVADDAQVGAEKGLAYRICLAREILGREDGAQPLGEAVQLDQVAVEAPRKFALDVER